MDGGSIPPISTRKNIGVPQGRFLFFEWNGAKRSFACENRKPEPVPYGAERVRWRGGVANT